MAGSVDETGTVRLPVCLVGGASRPAASQNWRMTHLTHLHCLRHFLDIFLNEKNRPKLN